MRARHAVEHGDSVTQTSGCQGSQTDRYKDFFDFDGEVEYHLSDDEKVVVDIMRSGGDKVSQRIVGYTSCFHYKHGHSGGNIDLNESELYKELGILTKDKNKWEDNML